MVRFQRVAFMFYFRYCQLEIKNSQNYPVMHFLFCCGCQANWPSLLCPFRCIQCKGMFGFIQNFNYNSDFIQEHVDILRQEKKKLRLRQTQIYLPQSQQDHERGTPAKDSKESVLGTEGMGLNFQTCTTSDSYCLYALTRFMKTLASQAWLFLHNQEHFELPKEFLISAKLMGLSNMDGC